MVRHGLADIEFVHSYAWWYWYPFHCHFNLHIHFQSEGMGCDSGTLGLPITILPAARSQVGESCCNERTNLHRSFADEVDNTLATQLV